MQWEDYLPKVLLTKPAEVVQETCQVLEKHGCSVKKELKSELYYSSTLCQVVFRVLHYANMIVAHAPTAWTALMLISTICLRMHSKLCDELSSHAHAHANNLTVLITSNTHIICNAHMRFTCVSVSGVGVGGVLLSGSFSCVQLFSVYCVVKMCTQHTA